MRTRLPSGNRVHMRTRPINRYEYIKMSKFYIDKITNLCGLNTVIDYNPKNTLLEDNKLMEMGAECSSPNQVTIEKIWMPKQKYRFFSNASGTKCCKMLLHRQVGYENYILWSRQGGLPTFFRLP